jgi:spore coat polysaccharide biosynthesis protein SpsF
MNETAGKRVVAIVQARMGSTRLPGKVLKEVLGKTLLEIELERIKRAELLDAIVVATTEKPTDRSIEEVCKLLEIPVFRGAEDDVLDRFYRAAKEQQAEVIVRLTADCPLIDPAIIDQVVTFYINNLPEYDYVSNTEARTFPRGMDVEVFSMEALEEAWQKAKKPEEREHVTPYIYRNRKLFDIGIVMRGTNEAKRRWTVDTPEDLELITKILEALYPEKPKFTIDDIFEVLEENPEWEKINEEVKQKKLDDPV